jgi:hypothetical protein
VIEIEVRALPPLDDIDPRGDRVTVPLAPGVPIFVGAARRRAGVAAVVVMDGRPHLITCGHVFDGGAGAWPRRPDADVGSGRPDADVGSGRPDADVGSGRPDADVGSGRPDASVYAAEIGGPVIATLTRSYLEEAPRLDAAVCELTPEGILLLEASKGAKTWFPTFRTPAEGDADELAIFWPTHETAGAPFAMKPSSWDASTQVLFPGGPHTGFIKLPFTAKEGDSGSVLSMGGAYYALCSGQVGTTFFTPIAAVLSRLKKEYGKVELWQP